MRGWMPCILPILLVVFPAYGWFWRGPFSYPCSQPLPPAPVYGSVYRTTHTSGVFRYQDAIYRCLPGYKLVGVSKRTCTFVWNHETPVCQLAIYDSTQGNCDFSYGSNCLYVNSASNKYKWTKETVVTYKMTDVAFPSSPCIGGFYSGPASFIDSFKPEVTKETLPAFSLGGGTSKGRRSISQVENIEKTTDGRSNLDRVRRSCFRVGAKNVAVTPTTTTSTVLTATTVVSNEVFEVGKFVKHVSNGYIKFTFTASEGLGYYFYCYAHCLPDPPGSFDQVGSVQASRSHETFTLYSSASSGSHTVCLNLKDSVDCGEFAMRFSVSILHLSTQSARLSFTPKGVYSSLAQAGCAGVAANET